MIEITPLSVCNSKKKKKSGSEARFYDSKFSALYSPTFMFPSFVLFSFVHVFVLCC